MIYVRDDISSKLLTKHFFPNNMEDIFVKLNFINCKWPLLGTYHPPSQSDEYFFENVNKESDTNSTYSYYDKILLTGDLYKIYDHYLETSLCQHGVVKRKAYFKSISNPGSIDLFLTNNSLSFQSTKTITQL